MGVDEEPIIIEWPAARSKLIVVDEGLLTIEFPHPKPNWWFRLWQRWLLGFRWEDV